MDTSGKTLDDFNREEVYNRVPVIVFISVVAVLGIIGNAHVLYIYKTKFKKSTYRVFILGLATVDMVCCCVSMPFEIADEFHPYSFFDVVSCKIFRFINTCIAVTCGFLLVLIASERYRRICKPHGNQMSETSALYATLGVVLAGVIFTFPAIYVYGSKTITFSGTNVTGSECTWGDHMDGTLYGYFYYIWVLLTIITCMVGLAVVYTIIITRLKRHNRTIAQTVRRSLKLSKPAPDVDVAGSRSSNIHQISVAENPGDKKVNEEDHETEQKQDNSSVDSKQNLLHQENPKPSTDTCDTPSDAKNAKDVNEDVNDRNLVDKNSDKECEKRKSTTVIKTLTKQMRNSSAINGKEQRITKVLFTITLLFILSFMPYIIILIVYATDRGFSDNLNNTERTLYMIGVRLYLINSAANSILYGFFDFKFRKNVKEWYMSHFMRCRRYCQREY